jgi:hypothetical protein
VALVVKLMAYMCRKYHKLPEVTSKVKDAKLKEEAQRNRLRAQLYKEVTLTLIAAKNVFAVDYVIVRLLYLVGRLYSVSVHCTTLCLSCRKSVSKFCVVRGFRYTCLDLTADTQPTTAYSCARY